MIYFYFTLDCLLPYISHIMDTKALKPAFTALVKAFTLGLQNIFDNENNVHCDIRINVHTPDVSSDSTILK